MINTKYNRNSCGAGTISSGYIRLLLLSVLLVTICFFHYPPVAISREIIGSEFRSLEEDSSTATMPKPKVLIYITTHMSSQHKDYFKHCWPKALQNSQLLNSSDVRVYITGSEDFDIFGDIKMLRQIFKNQNLEYNIHPNPGLVEGAMSALSMATKSGWFDEYDWVFRMNPDVIIQDDKWMLDTITNDTEAALLYTECKPQRPPMFKNVNTIMTDFFALKPSALPRGHLGSPLFIRNAEAYFTRQMQCIVEEGRHRHVPNAFPLIMNACRVNGNAGDSPVVHFHDDFDMIPQVKNGICPALFSNNDINLA